MEGIWTLSPVKSAHFIARVCPKSIVSLMPCFFLQVTKRLSDSSGVTQQSSSNTETRNQAYCVPPVVLMCIHRRQIHFHIKRCTECQICAHTHTLLSTTIHTCFGLSALKKTSSFSLLILHNCMSSENYKLTRCLRF